MRIDSALAKRWGAAGALVVAVYAAVGFWAVPAIVRQQWVRAGDEVLKRQASIGETRFNPFTLRLAVRDLALAERDGTPLFSAGEVVVEFQWRAILRRAWSFSEVRLTEPSVHLAIAPDGRFNIAELVATVDTGPKSTGPTTLPRIAIAAIAIERGRIDMRDRRAGYENRFTPIDLQLTDFSTLPDETDSLSFKAESPRGGKLHWRSKTTLDPLNGEGTLTLENVSLPDAAAYLKSVARVDVASGQLSATIPYRFASNEGRFEARLQGARLSVADLAVARQAERDPFAALTRLDVTGIDVDLVKRDVAISELRLQGGRASARRDAKGELDLQKLAVASPTSAPAPSGAPARWHLALKQASIDGFALAFADETARPALKVTTTLGLQARIDAGQEAAGTVAKVSDAALTLKDTMLASGAQVPVKLAELGFTGGQLDLGARTASVERAFVQGGQLQVARDAKGALNLLALLPGTGTAKPAPASPSPPWNAQVRLVEIGGLGAALRDEASGLQLNLANISARAEGAGTNLKQPVKFSASLAVREGGQLSAQGSVVPATAAVQADVRIHKLSLAPVQPLLARHVKLTLASGQLNAQGRVTTGAGDAKSPALRYAGSFGVGGLALVEEDGAVFASWKDVRTEKLTFTLGPDLLDVPELRVVEANAKLIIDDDRSLNASRLLVAQPAAVPASAPASAPAAPLAPAASAPGADEAFPVRVRRLRLENAKLDFADNSLRPQFGAKIHELSGVVNGLSTHPETRSQIELDGRVDEFGLARIRGELNPFAWRRNTDVNVVFRNVDMVSASPYAMKFAGYRIAEGRISLDLQYKVRDSQLVGANQVVLDRFTLGERVDSPDALKLPLELAIAILKDSDGRIDLGLPVEGNIDDPQFRYGPLVWKALGNLLAKIATAPFRALGGLLGVGGDKLEAIDFDAGSAKLLPPEREKLKQVGQILSKRPQLKLLVPGQYSEAADGAALRQRAVRLEVFKRAGVKIEAGDEPGPLDFGSRSVRGAVRDLYAARFGAAELDKQKKAAESAAPAPGGAPAAPLPVWQRVGALVQGEPQVADASAFYAALVERLDKEQPLPAGALASLGAARSEAIVAAMKEAGVDPARFAAGAAEKNDAPQGRIVPLKLGLAAR